MWNDLQTDAYEGMLSETVTIPGANDERVNAYFSRPLGSGPYPAIVLIPHMPGWDELNREIARRFSQHGFLTICPDIYQSFGHGTPWEVAQTANAAGGVPDQVVMAECESALSYLTSLPYSNGRVGVIGMCSGGRHAFLAACRGKGFAAAVDLWGGCVVMDKSSLTPARPVAPIDLTSELSCPLLGIFGNDDQYPTPEEVDLHEEELRKHGKDYTFHRYDRAGHAFWNYASDSYRPAQAIDSWNKVLAFFNEQLQKTS
ncbi:MAG: dienelactone hydrolase family protein [Propionibacteriaceae bacterium]|nr:dienelactone hydrolase family protein [Propionibacteriaceae bacterium]